MGRARRARPRYDAPAGRSTGTSFAVWAPNARGVRVVGDFNDWDGTRHPMRSLGGRGVWELFVPGVGAGHARTSTRSSAADGVWRRRPTRWPGATEVPPATASVVDGVDLRVGRRASGWTERARKRPRTAAPMSVYEVHLGSWRPGLAYRELADQLVAYVDRTGLHPRGVPAGRRAPVRRSWGYQVTVVLRADLAVRHARTSSATWSTRCTRPASA